MIISASRRTDIPSYYSQWFFNRLRARYVYVRNPMNAHQISQISLSPEVVDGIVFWTKNPIPMLDQLDKLRDYMYYFQFTITSYGTDAEQNIPSKNTVIVPAFQRLSDTIGPDRVIWRYDPIFLNGTYTVDYHVHYFEKLAKRLAAYTRKCTISFLDTYDKTKRNIAPLAPTPFSVEQQDLLAKELSGIAHSYGLRMDTCAEGIDLDKYGIEHARCIDGNLFEQLLHCPLQAKKDKNQRPECGCMEALDIGAYNTCRNGCRYCYANFSESTVASQSCRHDPDSPLLIGAVGPEDKVSPRKVSSYKDNQICLFETQTQTQTVPGADGYTGAERSGKQPLPEQTASNAAESAR